MLKTWAYHCSFASDVIGYYWNACNNCCKSLV